MNEEKEEIISFETNEKIHQQEEESIYKKREPITTIEDKKISWNMYKDKDQRKIKDMVKKRITITIHKLELDKLRKIAKENYESISGMITRLIQEYKK